MDQVDNYENYNPWKVENFDDFLYYCCPECDFRHEIKTEFIAHAVDHHPKSHPHIPTEIKKEQEEWYSGDNDMFVDDYLEVEQGGSQPSGSGFEGDYDSFGKYEGNSKSATFQYKIKGFERFIRIRKILRVAQP